jgi:ribonuclease J
MVKRAAEEGVDLLLTEGTRVDQPPGTTEDDVHRNASKLIKEARGLAVVNYPPRDLARFLTFHRIAEATGRKLVIGFKQAVLIEEYRKIDPGFPSIDDPGILIYAERKEWGTAGRKDVPSNIPGMCIPEEVCDQDYRVWEREYLHRGNCVNYLDLRDHSEYMFYCNYFQLNELIDVKPAPGSVYIRSVTEPFDDEMEFDARRVDNWLNLFSLTQYGRSSDDGLHASGHASGDELREMINEIKPRTIIPIHTEHPEAFKSMFGNVVTVEGKGSFSL